MNTQVQSLIFINQLLRSPRMPKDIKSPFNMQISEKRDYQVIDL